mmetsp:Transcript_72119/g.215181  ORF Transcript_72119/g.215181 Transcript_72119/m.215181 type:complete len:292 (-) Transcript_72119:428-1303(-)
MRRCSSSRSARCASDWETTSSCWLFQACANSWPAAATSSKHCRTPATCSWRSRLSTSSSTCNRCHSLEASPARRRCSSSRGACCAVDLDTSSWWVFMASASSLPCSSWNPRIRSSQRSAWTSSRSRKPSASATNLARSASSARRVSEPEGRSSAGASTGTAGNCSAFTAGAFALLALRPACAWLASLAPAACCSTSFELPSPDSASMRFIISSIRLSLPSNRRPNSSMSKSSSSACFGGSTGRVAAPVSGDVASGDCSGGCACWSPSTLSTRHRNFATSASLRCRSSLRPS